MNDMGMNLDPRAGGVIGINSVMEHDADPYDPFELHMLQSDDHDKHDEHSDWVVNRI